MIVIVFSSFGVWFGVAEDNVLTSVHNSDGYKTSWSNKAYAGNVHSVERLRKTNAAFGPQPCQRQQRKITC